MKNLLSSLLIRFGELLEVMGHRISFLRSADILIEDYLAQHLYGNPSIRMTSDSTNSKHKFFHKMARTELSSKSFAALALINKFFVEFGVGDGLENNTVALLLHGWQGAWIEGDRSHVKKLARNLVWPIREGSWPSNKPM
jgi:hypothetical protein